MGPRRRATGLLLVAVLAACGRTGLGSAPPDLVVGAVLPLGGSQAPLAREELNGIRIAIDHANALGGVQGRQVRLVTRDAQTREAAAAAAHWMRARGATVVIGSYSSDLSLPAATAAASEGLVYWESGAVADQLTGQGLPMVFRVGAAGSNLGHRSVAFAAEQLAPRLGLPLSRVRLAVVRVREAYGDSVADAALAEAASQGLDIVGDFAYDVRERGFGQVLDQVAASRPDILVLVSHVPDGVAFREAMLARGLRVGALIGSTMAECGPEFGALLGADAVGVFASDRPTRGFNPAALSRAGRAAYDLLASAYRARFHREAGEEAISGFSAAWALFEDVLPAALTLDPAGIANAARRTKLADGDLPNGGGLDFSTDPARLGQNLRAASVVWQWQGVRQSVTVWPPVFATGQVEMVPLPR
ncbi:MAG TPA: ABC transporter substrate-binding protein [Candidatus Dormibacteraeota bacterium]|jgi:branched-chain amino acid transport system substrate-binding protein|nr:ABC transporter substrate-binding protein [Candidatus Dormibacteraeota bacterium]